MKALVILFCLGVLEITVFGDNTLQNANFQKRVYPKKVNPLVHKNLKLLNRNYFKKSHVDEAGLPLHTKKHGANSQYTAFPPNSVKQKILDIPESPYFPPDNTDDNNAPKPRVKKVLNNQFFSELRQKRSLEKESDAKNPPIPKSRKKRSPEKESDAKNPPTPKSRKKRSPEKEVDAKHPPVSKSKKEKRSLHKSGEDEVPERDLRNVKISDKVSTKDNKAKKSEKDKKSKSNRSNSDFPKVKKSKRSKNKEKTKKKSKKNIERRRSSRDGRRLIAGRDANIEDYPYTVSIQKDGDHWCAGALLNPRLVITTANCVWKSNRMSRLRVRAGSRFASHGGQVVKVAEVMKHPQWSIRKNPNCDLALLLLEKNVRFSHSVHALDLPNRVMMPEFDDAWVTSWGSERRDGIFEKKEMTLQVYHTRLMRRDECSNITQRFGVMVTENFICLAQEGRRAPCTRDTGAPAVSDGVLWGLASWGIRKLCGTQRFPAMFSYIASPRNMDFISNATTYLMSEPRESPFLGRYDIPHDKVKKLAPLRRGRGGIRLYSKRLSNLNRRRGMLW